MTRLLLAAILVLQPAMPAAQVLDHELARRAVGRGDVMPLERILALIEARYPGRILEVELEDEDGVWLYEIEILTPTGRVLEIELDPRTGAVLSLEEDDD